MTLGLDGGRRERSMQRLKLDPLTPRAGAMISARAPSIDAYQFRFRKWRTHFVFALDSMFIEIIGPPVLVFSAISAKGQFILSNAVRVAPPRINSRTRQCP